MNKFLRTVLVVLSHCASAAAGSIWVEGESGESKTVQKHGWYSNVKTDGLSGGGLLSHWGGETGKAGYHLAIPEGGKYALWVRANPVQAKLRIQVGEGKWMEPNLKSASREQINIAGDDKPDLRFIAWIKAGELILKKGPVPVSVEFASGNNHHGMLDCFCLTTDLEWKPRGILKPGEKPRHWQIQKINGANLDRWIDFIRPSGEELGWRAIRWHSSLSEAAEEAEKLKRPILLWAMNGHPCGET